MKEFNYIVFLEGDSDVISVTRAFSKKLSDEQLNYLYKDLSRAYSNRKVISHEVSIKEVK